MAKKRDDEQDSMAVDAEGHSLPMTSAQVRAHVDEIVSNGGEILALIVRRGNELAVPVFGPPSLELLDILETVTAAYRRTLKGH